MAQRPTLVSVHAHPDDEAFFGAGAVAHYAKRGYRLVLVTCTNGALGFDPEGRAGNDPRHDDLATKVVRAGELQRAASLLGYQRVVSLGYDDSGMAGWPQNDAPTAFVNADLDASARFLAALFDEERATVVVTYDENGFYGHPDHVRANRLARRASELSSSVERLYYPVVPASVISSFVEGAHELGLALPAWVLDAGTNVADDQVATTLDVRRYATLKQRVMATHASQVDNADLVGMKQELFTLLFGTEYYQRAWSRHASSGDATDLFGGLKWD